MLGHRLAAHHAHQEGLTTFAEIITGAMDINRLRRLALRVLRLQEALAGADFIEVFRAFLDAGQSEVESYRSAQRIFRGGDVRGRVAFTKDGAYLEGLLLVTAFIKRALHENRGDTLRLLFCGRVALGDLVTLARFRDTGLVAAPHYVPPWARHLERVLATLAFSTAAQSLRWNRSTCSGSRNTRTKSQPRRPGPWRLRRRNHRRVRWCRASGAPFTRRPLPSPRSAFRRTSVAGAAAAGDTAATHAMPGPPCEFLPLPRPASVPRRRCWSRWRPCRPPRPRRTSRSRSTPSSPAMPATTTSAARCWSSRTASAATCAASALADVAHGVPNTPATRYRVASITKLFTAAVILQLQQEGRLDLQAPFTRYLPECTGEGAREVSVHQLLNHTSGLKNFDHKVASLEQALAEGMPNYQLPHTGEQLARDFCNGPRVQPPGTTFDYDNGDYLVLGRIIEKLTGQRWEQAVRERILAPLRLDDTGLLHHADIVEGLSVDLYLGARISRPWPTTCRCTRRTGARRGRCIRRSTTCSPSPRRCSARAWSTATASRA
ncbi:DUF1704 domain-containing protein [Pseudoxanthomonas sp. NC8]|nr:DUF1704 domain-containing protein [Pseudoxanthomonas sp. NC8]